MASEYSRPMPKTPINSRRGPTIDDQAKIKTNEQLIRWFELTATQYELTAASYRNKAAALSKSKPSISNDELLIGWSQFANFMAGVAQAMWCRYTLRRSKNLLGYGKSPTSGEMWTIPEIINAYINTNHLPFHDWKTTRQLWLDTTKQQVFDWKTNDWTDMYSDNKVPARKASHTSYKE